MPGVFKKLLTSLYRTLMYDGVSSDIALAEANDLITFFNRRLPFGETINRPSSIRIDIRGELEGLVWAYALARKTITIETIDGDGPEGEKYREAYGIAAKIEEDHGVELREYLAPYIDRPYPFMSVEEWHRSYASCIITSPITKPTPL